MKELKKVDVLSVAKVSAIWTALMSIIIVVFVRLLQAFGGDYFAEPLVAGFTLTGLLIGILFYLALGFFCGALSAWIYNLTAKLVGGIKLKL